MNILILSAHTERIDAFAKLTVVNKQEYANKFGYTFINITNGFDLSRAPSWSKILFIKQYLHEYDYIFWMDSDAMFMRFDIRLEEFIHGYEKYDFIFNRDNTWEYPKAVRFNCGVFFIKNSEFSFNLLDEVYKPEYYINSHIDEYGRPTYYEQGVFWRLNDEHNYKEIKVITDNQYKGISFNGIKSNWMNNYIIDPIFLYKPGDFVYHLAGDSDVLGKVIENLNLVVDEYKSELKIK